MIICLSVCLLLSACLLGCVVCVCALLSSCVFAGVVVGVFVCVVCWEFVWLLMYRAVCAVCVVHLSVSLLCVLAVYVLMCLSG